MSTFYFLLAFLIATTQRAHTFYPYGGYYSDYPVLGYSGLTGYPYSSLAYPYGYPYGVYSHHYHPRAAVHNLAKSFHKEAGHLSDTMFVSPLKTKATRKN